MNDEALLYKYKRFFLSLLTIYALKNEHNASGYACTLQ